MENKRNEILLQKSSVVWLGAMICCLLWGSAFPCIKLGYLLTGIASDDTASQILYAGIRFTLAGILTILIASLLGHELILPEKGSLPKIAELSLLQTVLQYLFFYIGLAHTSGVKASIIEGVNVFVAILISSLLFHMEKITPRKIIGCIIGFAGLVLVNITGSSLGGSLSLTGEGFIFFSTVAYAFSSVLLKRLSAQYNPVMLSGWQFVFGGLIMAAAGLLFGGHVVISSASGFGMLLWLSFVSAGAYSLWGILLKYNPVSRVAVFGFMNPVFGVILSSVLLKEGKNLNIMVLFSLILVCAGIYIVNSSKKE